MPKTTPDFYPQALALLQECLHWVPSYVEQYVVSLLHEAYRTDKTLEEKVKKLSSSTASVFFEPERGGPGIVPDVPRCHGCNVPLNADGSASATNPHAENCAVAL